MDFDAKLNGTVNEQTVQLNGSGNINQTSGRTIGNYSLVKIPSGLHPHYLSACLITGYPNASAVKDGIPNIFQNHDYWYRRILTFTSGESLSLTTNCQLKGKTLVSTFHLDGLVPVEEVFQIEPLLETWQPNGPGEIVGRFVAKWKKKSGGYVKANSLTEYHIESNEEQQGLLHRSIKILSQIEGDKLHKSQESLLFK